MSDEEKQARILVVDDTPANLELLDEILNRRYRILAALNGERALELARSKPPPDLILLDIMMPEMDGHEVCRQLKADPATRDIPVIFVTARSEVADERAGFQLGAVDYITKPISPPIVEARVATQLALHNQRRELEFQVAVRTEQLSLANAELEEFNTRLRHEVHAREQAMARAEYLSQFDALTGLPNRRQAQEKLRHLLLQARDRSAFVVIAHIDLDRMQRINNALGSASGDELLVLAGRRLMKHLHHGEVVARDGGDNFIVIPQEFHDSARAAEEHGHELVAGILELITEPFTIDERPVRVTASAGLAIFPRDCDTGANLLTRAQIATSRAKNQGGNRVEIYQSALGSGHDTRFATEGRLREAIHGGQLEIFLQPQVELATHKIIGAETLVRWPDGQGGYIPNGSFIPLAEEAGLIRDLDHFVLRELCTFIRTKASHFPSSFRFSFNFSPMGFQDLDAIEQIIQIIDDSAVSPGRLELEVTEYAVVADVASAVDKLNRLRGHGVRVALDDFGTGYSSLAYLKSLPLDQVKIDAAFVHDIERDETGVAIARTIIVLANTLRLDVVAEGIETQSQLDFVRSCGCRTGQGFFMYRPKIADDLLQYFKD